MLPPTVLIINGITKKNAPISEPKTQLAKGYAHIAPMMPVPMTSPMIAPHMLCVRSYNIPDNNAPHILPGYARSVPVPKRLRIVAVKKDAPTA